MKSDFLRQRFPKAIKRWALPLAITAFLWFTRSNEITVVQLSLAFFLLCVPWQAYINWKTNTKSYLPLFAMVTFMYWLYYVVPLFWEPQTISEVSAPLGRELSQSSITESLWMVALGVSSLWIGMRVGFGRRLSPRRLSIELPQSRRSYIRAVLAVGCLLNFYDVSPYTLGEGGRQLINLLLAVVPMLTFAVLFHSYLKREATYVDKVLMLAFLVTRLFNGFSCVDVVDYDVWRYLPGRPAQVACLWSDRGCPSGPVLPGWQRRISERLLEGRDSGGPY